MSVHILVQITPEFTRDWKITFYPTKEVLCAGTVFHETVELVHATLKKVKCRCPMNYLFSTFIYHILHKYMHYQKAKLRFASLCTTNTYLLP